VLADDGVVLLRGLVRDRTRRPWFSVFPGHERALLRFPTLNDLDAVFATRGFRLVEVVQVAEGETTSARQADWVDAIRDADSILTALTDDEIADGISALRSKPDDVLRHELTLVVFG
jgi:hypothetical protein